MKPKFGVIKMKYQLLYRNKILAEVTEEDSDFPTFFGKYKLADGLQEDPEFTHLLSYMNYSARVWPLIEADRMDEIDYGEESKFTDLIESENWWLIDQDGKKIAILIPIFCTYDQINWRLDPDTSLA